MSVTIANAHTLARSVGLSHEAAVTAVAVAIAESGLNENAVGDESLQDATWGPSIGLWQIRSLKAQSGTGGVRDATQLKNPSFNARSMASISNRGSDWSPWTTYNNGAYRSHLGAVRAAAGEPSSLDAPMPSGAATVPSGDVADVVPDTFGWVAAGVNDSVRESVMAGLLWSAAFGLAVTLVAIGAYRAVQP